MARYAVVRTVDNVCVNTIIAETYTPAPIGCVLINIDNIYCGPGWIYDPVINDFYDPNPPPPEEGGG